MDNKILFKKTKQQQRWNTSPSGSFNIDDNLSITMSVFRSTRKDNKNANHIQTIHLNTHINGNHKQYSVTTYTIQNLDEKIGEALDSLNVKGFKRSLYFYTIHAIVLKVICFPFVDTKQNETIDVSQEKENFDSFANYQFIENIDLGDWKKILKSKDIWTKFYDKDIKNMVDCSAFNQMISKFEKMLTDTKLIEADWQKFFTENNGILSSVFPMPIIQYQDKAYIGNKTIKNTGGELIDYVYKNEFTTNSYLIEIKTPQTTILNKHEYRAGVFDMSHELTGGINQLMQYKDSFTNKCLELTKGEAKCWNINMVLVIGKISDLDSKQIKEFELLRNSINNMQIITFDELLKKLQNTLNNIKQ